jgi:hypothetical protein
MNSIDYKQKYLKYKNKYLELKDIEKQKVLSGGFMYVPGEYVFFIPESTKKFVDNDYFVNNNNNIPSLDKLTTQLGNCTRFLRIGTNVNNKTIYTNQSSMDVIKRETKDIKDKSIETYNDAKDKTQQAWVEAKPYVDQVANTASNLANTASNLATQAVNLVIKKGGDDCDKLPIPLPDDKFPSAKGFAFDNEVNETSLNDYIKLINEKQGSEKIGRVIVVQKKTNSLGFGGETRLKYDFAISYATPDTPTPTIKLNGPKV